jgi:SAM-dependent methyltransferase
MSLYDYPELYDELFPAAPACLDFYTSLAVGSGGPVLELACGTGQLMAPIAMAGVAIVGIDDSLAMVRHAGRRGGAQRFVADIRRFEIRRTFPLIFIARNSLLHLTDNNDLAACLITARRHLAPGFAFDVFNPSEALLSRPANVRFPVIRLESRRFGAIVVEETSDYDPATRVNRAT